MWIVKFSRILRKDLKSLVALAWPIILSRLGIVTLFLIDFLMVGRYSADHIAYLGLGMTPATVFVPIVLGLLMGTLVLVTRHYGAREYKTCGEIWRQSLPYAVWVGLAGMMFCALGEQLLLLTGQEEKLAYEAGRVSLFGALGIPFLAVGMTSGFFLEGIGRVRAVMVGMALANVLNIIFNYALIFGHWGFPEWGAAGAALGTGLARVLQAIFLTAYILLMREQKTFAVRVRPKRNRDLMSEHRRIGYSGGISIGLEHFAFASLTIYAGWLGSLTLAAHTITFNFFGVLFMLGLGIGTATAVRAGHHFGAKKYKSFARTVWFGLSVQIAVTLSLAVLCLAFGERIIGLYTDELNVIVLASMLLTYVAFALWLDTGQILFSQNLRIIGDVWTPSYIHTIAYLFVMLPAAWVFAFPLGRGAMGLIDGFAVGCATAFVLGLARYVWVMRQVRAHPESFAPAAA